MKKFTNLLIVIAVFSFSIVTGYTIATKTPEEVFNLHYCNWDDCQYKGEVMDQWKFTSKSGAEELTDTWCMEITHFMNPTWTHEQCEDYVMSGVE